MELVEPVLHCVRSRRMTVAVLGRTLICAAVSIMVELKRLEATVAELEDALKEGDWDAACTDLAVLKLRYAAISAVKCKLEEDVLPKIARFVVRANEPDPEKRVYGPGTVTKVCKPSVYLSPTVSLRVTAPCASRSAC